MGKTDSPYPSDFMQHSYVYPKWDIPIDPVTSWWYMHQEKFEDCQHLSTLPGNDAENPFCASHSTPSCQMRWQKKKKKLNFSLSVLYTLEITKAQSTRTSMYADGLMGSVKWGIDLNCLRLLRWLGKSETMGRDPSCSSKFSAFNLSPVPRPFHSDSYSSCISLWFMDLRSIIDPYDT